MSFAEYNASKNDVKINGQDMPRVNLSPMGSANYGYGAVPIHAKLEINEGDTVLLNTNYHNGILLILGEFNMDNMTKV